MSTKENKQKSTNKYFKGIKLSSAFPLLKVIAEQNGLNLNRAREFGIAKNLLVNSIVYN